MMNRSGIIVKLLICALMLAMQPVLAQPAGDTLKTDSVRNKYLPSAIRIGTDVISLGKTRFQENFTGRELNAEVEINRYLLALEFGNWGRDLTADSAAYSNSGSFWRVGVDVNFLKNDPDKNVFSLGARYGRAKFSETMNVTSSDPFWGDLTDNYYNENVGATWLELTAGLRVKIWKFLWFGYTGRLKFALKTDLTEEMLPYDVPGFGQTDKETTWGFNYYVMARIPLRKQAPVAAK